MNGMTAFQNELMITSYGRSGTAGIGCEYQYTLYVIRFDDNRIKFGVTSGVKKRMSYYRQEARRNNIDFLVWFAVKPFQRKEQALHAERAMRLIFREQSRKSQREWLIDGADFAQTIKIAEELRAYLGDEDEIEKIDMNCQSCVGYFKGILKC